MVTRKSGLLLNFLDIRVIVNGGHIYSLYRERPVIIPVTESHPVVVITDGFHFTRPIRLSFRKGRTRRIEVVCRIDDNLLSALLAIMLLCSIIGVISKIYLLKLVAFFPVLYFLYCFYIRRREYIQMKKH